MHSLTVLHAILSKKLVKPIIIKLFNFLDPFENFVILYIELFSQFNKFWF